MNDVWTPPPIKPLSEYEVDERTGFLPSEEPSKKLPVYYHEWEAIIDKLPELIASKEIRKRVDKLPLLEVSQVKLKTKADWWRAYIVTTFIGQAYIWMNQDDTEVMQSVPRSIAIPWCKVSDYLDMPPVVTYSTACLYNWGLHDPQKPPSTDNLYSLITYTGLKDEQWFYIVLLLTEIAAAPGIKAVVEAYRAIERNDQQSLAENLKIVKLSIEQIIVVLKLYHTPGHCRPRQFYHQIRRFQRGTNQTDGKHPEGYHPNGLQYEGVDPQPEACNGASAVQSSTIPVFDIFLGVEHTGEELDFLQKQRKYMPPPHREFLETLEKQNSVRLYIKESNNQELMQSFDDIVATLHKFRTSHMKQLVQRFILEQMAPEEKAGATGTAGTKLKVFLTKVRDDTPKAKVSVHKAHLQ